MDLYVNPFTEITRLRWKSQKTTSEVVSNYVISLLRLDKFIKKKKEKKRGRLKPERATYAKGE